MTDQNKGIDIASLLAFRDKVKEDPSKADRNPTLIAEWVEGDQSRVKFGEIEPYRGGEGNLNPMQMFLACLADLALIMHKLNHNSFSYNKRYPGVSSVSLFL